MHKDDIDKFYNLLFLLAKYYKEEIDETILSLWFNALNEFELRDIENALMNWIKVSSRTPGFMPKIADVIQAIKGDTTQDALQAWVDAFTAVRKIGAYDAPLFQNAIITEVIYSLGGWVRFCSLLIDKDLPFIERRFIDLYKMYAAREDRIVNRELKGINSLSELGYQIHFIQDKRYVKNKLLKKD